MLAIAVWGGGRCSTLYPCLQAMYRQFYQKHIDEYEKGLIDNTGSDDLIYTRLQMEPLYIL